MPPRCISSRRRETQGANPVSDLSIPLPTKRCTKCGEDKPLDQFSLEKRHNRLLARCKVCVAAIAHQRYLENIEKRREYRARYVAEHREENREYCRNYRVEHRDERIEADRRYNAAHKEEKLAYNHQYYAENRERLQEYQRQYDAANKEQIREKHREWVAQNPDYARRQYAKNPEKGRLRTHIRRANKRANGGTYTTEDLAAIRAAQTDKQGRLICWRCGKPITDTPHLDHWIPLKRGGRNDAGNLHYMHAHCNSTKQAKHPTEIGRLL